MLAIDIFLFMHAIYMHAQKCQMHFGGFFANLKVSMQILFKTQKYSIKRFL